MLDEVVFNNLIDEMHVWQQQIQQDSVIWVDGLDYLQEHELRYLEWSRQ